jgi:hypothetical protein
MLIFDRLCGLVVRVTGYRSRGPGSIAGANRFSEMVGLQRGPLSLVSTIEDTPVRKKRLRSRKPILRPEGSAALTTQHPTISKSWR